MIKILETCHLYNCTQSVITQNSQHVKNIFKLKTNLPVMPVRKYGCLNRHSLSTSRKRIMMVWNISKDTCSLSKIILKLEKSLYGLKSFLLRMQNLNSTYSQTFGLYASLWFVHFSGTRYLNRNLSEKMTTGIFGIAKAF